MVFLSLPALLGPLGPMEMLIVGIVAVLLFGSQLPSVARSLGKSLTEFRRGMQDMQHEFRQAMNDADDAARAPVQGAQARLPAQVAHDDPSPDETLEGDPYDTTGAYPDEAHPPAEPQAEAEPAPPGSEQDPKATN